jgi:ABC-type transporter Mla MlaB component
MAGNLPTMSRKGEGKVLRITTQNDQDVTQFIVEGKLAGPCVCELEKCWTNLTGKEPASQVLVDLTSVTFVDSSGKDLLSRMFQQGARFTASLLMPKAIIHEIECGQNPES